MHNDVSQFFFDLDPNLIRVETSHKVPPTHSTIMTIRNRGFEVEHHKPPVISSRSAFVIGNPDKGKTYDANLNQDFNYQIGQSVESPVFGSGEIVKTFGSGYDITLQINFDGAVKVIMPKYAELHVK